MPYNVYMKEKQIHIRTDEEFMEKLEYLTMVNNYHSASEAVRKVIEKEYRKERTTAEELAQWIPEQVMHHATDWCGLEGVTMWNGALKKVWRHIIGDDEADW